MNLTSTEAGAYFDALRPIVESITSCDLFVLPPFTSIWVARDRLRGSNVAWGAQDVHTEPSGPHTGDISAAMLADLGCTFVEIGHSERRRDHAETDESVAIKVELILRHGMTPIICVGEPAGGSPDSALEHVLGQLQTVLRGVGGSDQDRLVIAYEPVWAIGEGATAAAPGYVGAVHSGIHEFLRSRAGGRAGARVIYGGSVDTQSAPALLEHPAVDGLFVGRAALTPNGFVAIAAGARNHRRTT